jgi:carboxylate-amine ligase
VLKQAAGTDGRRLAQAPAAEVLFSRFHDVSPLTLGVEEELMVVDAETLAPVPAAERVLASLGFDPCVGAEFRASQIELATPVCTTVQEVSASLAGLRAQLAEDTWDGVAFMAAGAHPSSQAGAVSERLRYRRIAAECPWAGRWMLTCGLHVHVGVPGPERALAVYNALRSYLPAIAAVGVNSPFYLGEDSGIASVRSQLNATLPRSGVPPAFPTVASYAAFVEWGAAGSVIADPGRLWWDLRLSPKYGTIEVRAPDVQTRVADTAAIAALVQSLVAWLAARFDGGERLPVEPSERIRENAWLAARDGTACFLVDLASGERMRTQELVGGLVQELMPTAIGLGCPGELADLLGLVALTGAERQRAVESRSGVDGLLAWLSQATVAATPADDFDPPFVLPAVTRAPFRASVP